ncbi:DinB family protein [Prauserella cavernicola]|uniref:DinB family protein n=1 Tax=Prauserella cavernicola TaxID=2800127 RepID=A0A934QPZ7_9PSEU|nr:DinB family protein [Prauserella cavernicola]MBK1784052.1 DinB family protein [Prauserella cavernicola]
MITPDDKDWTWVLLRRCPECGFEAGAVDKGAVPALLRANALAWRDVLAADDVRVRPRADRWSALEYACHVRDCCRIYDRRLALMLAHEGPEFPNWDQDVTAVEAAYGEQDPAVVADELVEAAEVLATSFERVSGEQWQRTGHRSDGADFTVDTFARYFIHDPVHHLHDVTGQD